MTNSDATREHLRGSTLLVGGRFVALLLNFVIQVVTVRYLTKDDFGIFAFSLSVIVMLTLVCAFGMDKTASRFLSVYLQKKDFTRFWGAIYLVAASIILAWALLALLFVMAWSWGLFDGFVDHRTLVVLAVMFGLAACDALNSTAVSMFAVLAHPSAIFVRRHLLGPLLKLFAAVVVVFSSGGLYAFAFGQMVAGLWDWLPASVCCTRF